jgi:hypothetical protein
LNDFSELFTDDILSANTFIFFVAGYETSASTISYCLYELAKNQEVQEKLRQQIMETLYANDGKLSYDIIKDMKYMDMVINGKYIVLIKHNRLFLCLNHVFLKKLIIGKCKCTLEDNYFHYNKSINTPE